LTHLNFEKIKEVLDRIPKEMEGLEAKIGWFPSSQYPDGTPAASVAATQEYGDPGMNIPARPFLRPTVQRDKAEWLKQLGLGLKLVLKDQMNGPDLLGAIAQTGAGGVQKSISQVYSPPLSPVTLMIRGMRAENPGLIVNDRVLDQARARISQGKPNNAPSTKPLVDTGYMLATVQGVVGESE
jgi:hypothetical protein